MTFITNYWVEIVLSVISIIVGAIVGYVFYRLQKRDVTSAQSERIKRAHEELLDVIESYIINKQNISENTIYNLLDASERQYQVDLRAVSTPITLLQDVALRLQKSRHLDVTQKSGYSTEIEKIISSITDLHKEIPEGAKMPLEIVATAEAALENNEKEKALEAIGHLKQELSKPLVSLRAENEPTTERWQVLTSLIAGIGTVVATFVAIADFTGVLGTVGIELIASFLTLITIITVIVIYVRRVAKQSTHE